VDRLTARGWLDGDKLTDTGQREREAIERATDIQLTPAIAALGDDANELVEILAPWGAAMRDAGGYVGGAGDLWPNRG
jgi:Helix-turn-helix family